MNNRFIVQWVIFGGVVFLTLPPLIMLHNNILCNRVAQAYEQQH